MQRFFFAMLVTLSITLGSFGFAHAQSDLDERNTEVVQSVYLRTLSVGPTRKLVTDAQTAFDLAMRSYGATNGRTADMAVNLGRALNRTSQHQAAIPLIESALSIYDDIGDPAQLRKAVAEYELGLAHLATDNAAAAVDALTKAFIGLEPHFKRLSANTNFIRTTLQAAGGDGVVQAAQTAAANVGASTTQQPKPTVKIPPIYPPDESLNGVGGWVLLDYRLWPDGRVRDVYILAAEPANVFDISAAMALQQWQFEPPVRQGEHYQLSVAFNAN
ncbi:MAG: TonB family protein [Rhodospirillaceae bacterium]